MNQTPNYQLNQWEAADRVQRVDFNADNAKIDAAIKAEADARSAQVSVLNAALNKCGNCKIVYQTYTGDGTCGPDHPKVFSFPSRPLLVVFGVGSRTVAVTYYGSSALTTEDGGSHWTYSITWGENSFSMMHSDNPSYQFNQSGTRYTVITLLAAD